MTTVIDVGDDAHRFGIGRRFLPVPAALWPPTVAGRGMVELSVAPGTPVFASTEGRVVEAAGHVAGEVVIRDVDERLIHYRRLLPSSVQVREGDRVAAGRLLGVAGPSTPQGHTTVAFGVRSASDVWLEVTDELCGAGDPDELFHPRPGIVGDPLEAAAGPQPGGPALAAAEGATTGEAAPTIERPAEPVGAPPPAVGAERRRRRRPADPRRIAATGPPASPADTGPAGPPKLPVTASPAAATAPEPPPEPDPISAPPPAVEPTPGPVTASPAEEDGPEQLPPRPPAAEDDGAAADPQDVFRKLGGRSRRRQR
jgi:hypothetical protein